MWGWFKITVYLGCKFQTCSSWKSSEFKMFIDDKLKFYVLHFSVWGDLWPYSNAYVRPGTRARKSRIKLFLDITSVFLCQITFSQESFLFLLSHFRIWFQLQQGRVFVRLSFQQLSSVFRVSFQTARKKNIIMRICENNAYWLGMMDLAILALKAYMGKPKESFIKKVTSYGV